MKSYAAVRQFLERDVQMRCLAAFQQMNLKCVKMSSNDVISHSHKVNEYRYQ